MRRKIEELEDERSTMTQKMQDAERQVSIFDG